MAMNRNDRGGPDGGEYSMRREREWAREDRDGERNDRHEYQGRSFRDDNLGGRMDDDRRFGGGGRYRSASDYGGSGDYGRGYGDDARHAGRGGRQRWADEPGPLREDEMILSGGYGSADMGMGMTGPFGYGQRYGQRGRAGDWRSGSDRDDRGFFDRAGDEVASWFGDRDAERRREVDAGHRGRGPKNYTRSDDRVREDVSDRLTDDHHLDASDIEVSVSDGEVTLDGTVDGRFAKRHAEDLAESASGVKHVQNNLRIKNQGTSTSGSTTGSDGGTGVMQTR